MVVLLATMYTYTDAWAGNWKFAGRASEGGETYFDEDSIRRTGNLATMSIYFTFPESLTERAYDPPVTYQSSEVVWKFDCVARGLVGRESIVFYAEQNRSGIVVRGYDKPEQYKLFNLSNILLTLYNIACSR
jgi:hypothetical protein